MNKCPKCNNNLSSIDILCPRCGALVEEIDTSVAKENIAPEESNDTDSEHKDELTDHYENLIMYNESFTVREPEEPGESEEPAKIEDDKEKSDAEIDSIIAAEHKSPYVNPLFAHIKKRQEEPIDEPTGETSADETSVEETPSDDETVEEKSVDVKKPIEDEKVIDETPAEDEIAEDTPADNEITDEEKSVEADAQKTSNIPLLEGVPKYSKDYLDAIRNIELPEDELDIEEDFDPNAFMVDFQKSAKDDEPGDKSSSSAKQFEKELNELSEKLEASQITTKRRRRFDPNRKKVEEEETELPMQKEQVETSAKDNSEKDKKNKEKKKVEPVIEALEMNLETERFFDDDTVAAEEVNAEFFVFGKDKKDFAADEKDSFKPTKNQYNLVNNNISNKKPIVASVENSKVFSKRKRLPIWAAILIWLAVSAAIFFGAYAFDDHVNSAYGSYSEYFSEITDGKIDIDAMID